METIEDRASELLSCQGQVTQLLNRIPDNWSPHQGQDILTELDFIITLIRQGLKPVDRLARGLAHCSERATAESIFRHHRHALAALLGRMDEILLKVSYARKRLAIVFAGSMNSLSLAIEYRIKVEICIEVVRMQEEASLALVDGTSSHILIDRPTRCFAPKVVGLLKAAFMCNQYPDGRTKEALAQQCGISLVQASSWFVNARRRLKQRKNTREATRFPHAESPTTRQQDEKSTGWLATLHSNTSSFSMVLEELYRESCSYLLSASNRAIQVPPSTSSTSVISVLDQFLVVSAFAPLEFGSIDQLLGTAAAFSSTDSISAESCSIDEQIASLTSNNSPEGTEELPEWLPSIMNEPHVYTSNMPKAG